MAEVGTMKIDCETASVTPDARSSAGSFACFRIAGGVPLEGEVRASGSKNATLPMMAAAILAAEPVRLEGVPQLADVRTLALVLQDLGLDVSWRDGAAAGNGRSPAGPRPLAAGAADAGEFLRAGTAAGAARPGHRTPARRLPHRRSAGRSASEGIGRPGRRLAAGARLRDRPDTAAPRRDHRHERSVRADGHRHGQRPQRGGAGPRRHADPGGRPRAGNRRSGPLPQLLGGADQRPGNLDHRGRRRRRTGRRKLPGHRRPHRGRHAAAGGGHHGRRGRGDGHRPEPLAGGARPAGGHRRADRGPRRSRRTAGRVAAAAGRYRGRALPRHPQRSASAVDGPDVVGPGKQHGGRSRLSRAVSARGRVEPAGGAHHLWRRRGARQRGRPARRRGGDGLGPAGQRRAGVGRPGRRRHDDGASHRPTRSRLRAAGAEIAAIGASIERKGTCGSIIGIDADALHADLHAPSI